MKIVRYPEKKDWQDVLARPVFDTKRDTETVQKILDDVKNNGDEALRSYSKLFDKVEIKDLAVSEDEFAEAERSVSEELKKAIGIAKENIEKFHNAQREESKIVETATGVFCWRKSVPIERVGLYVPAGTAPLFSTVLMLGVPAKLAGCREIVLCSPPDADGNIADVILYSARACGIEKVYKAGGAQAIAALAYGTETIPKVYKIFGPGNRFVTCAKQIVSQRDAAIDMPAGPSEVAVLADDSCVPAFVAADLLSQAEHGVDSQVLLVTTSEKVIQETLAEIEKQLAQLPRKDIAEKSLAESRAVLVRTVEEGIDVVNEYAAEHLILAVENAEVIAENVANAGSVFIGNYSCESAGDYASGTNHTLPTGGFAKSFSGVSLDSFVKKITFQKLTAEGVRNLGPTIETMAQAEGLDAHKNAISVRLRAVLPPINAKSVENCLNADTAEDAEKRKERSMFNLESLVRENIKRLTPYSSARKEFSGAAEIFLDANENSFGSPLAESYNRYPDPLAIEIKKRIAEINDVEPSKIFVGNGSDEAIDLLFRIFCRPQVDNVIICPPTYGMYEVSAEINDVETRRANLTNDFELDLEAIQKVVDDNTELIFLCSPNNPTGNLMRRETILQIAKNFDGIVVVDEAYIHFSNEKSLIAEIGDNPSLVVLQTFSKAWGLAGLRVGLAFAREQIIELFNKVKPPYNVSQAAQELILKALDNESRVTETIAEIARERSNLIDGLDQLSFVTKIYPSDANFVLVKTDDANAIYEYLLKEKIVVRNRNNVELCAGCLRITVGTPDESAALLAALKDYEKSIVY